MYLSILGWLADWKTADEIVGIKTLCTPDIIQNLERVTKISPYLQHTYHKCLHVYLILKTTPAKKWYRTFCSSLLCLRVTAVFKLGLKMCPTWLRFRRKSGTHYIGGCVVPDPVWKLQQGTPFLSSLVRYLISITQSSFRWPNHHTYWATDDVGCSL